MGDVAVRSRWRDPLLYAGLAVFGGIVALYLLRIGSDPPGLYDDEASIGYNAWTIVHYGTDQYGLHFPLFFTDFGDYKEPAATYLVAPLTWLLGTGPAVVRLPSVLAGIALCLIAGRLAFRLTGSQVVALLTSALTALQPWVFLLSHVMLGGNILMVLCAMLAVWLIAEAAADRADPRLWSLAGLALGVCVYTYSIGRLLALLIAGVAVVSFVRVGPRALARFVFPLAAAYIVLGAWWLTHPGALSARFQAVGLFSDHPSATTAIGRFAGNYVSYFSPDFLLIKGDGNLRQTTGFGGVLLGVTLPLVILGAIRVVSRWRQPYSRFIALGTLIAPVPAALALAAPHALRGAGLIPFFVVLLAEGTAWLWSLLRSQRLIAAALAVAAIGSATPYLVDFFTAYPTRAALAFQAGEGQALHRAYSEAEVGSHALFLSASLNQPALQLMYAVLAVPPQDDFIRRGRITVVVERRQLAAAAPGDVLVLGPADVPPTGTRLLFVVRGGRMLSAPVGISAADLLRVYMA